MGRGQQIFRDRRLDSMLRSRGYVTIRLVPEPAAQELRRAFGQLHGWERRQLIDPQPPDFEVSVWDSDHDLRSQVSTLIDACTAEPIERLFVSHRPIGTTMMIKWPAAEDHEPWPGVPDAFHNDSTYVDERTGARNYAMWLALQDTDRSNGAMEVVPHSHRLERTIRGWGVDAPWLAYEEVYSARARPVELRAGEAIVFDPALIHRSGPNRTTRPRAAATFLLAEPDIPLCIFRRRDESTIERVDLERGFFERGDYAEIAGRPPSEELAPITAHLTEHDVAVQLDRHARRSRRTLHRLRSAR